MSERSQGRYTVLFAGAVCIVCAVLVSSAAVLLRDRQTANAELDRQQNVLKAAGDLREGDDIDRAEIERRFQAFEVAAVDLAAGVESANFAIVGYDQRRALGDPRTSRAVDRNDAQVMRVPNHALVYKKRDANGRLDLLVLPVEGKGLWSTMYGFVALGPDLTTIRGLTFYQHGETPGLGGEIDNPRWKALWPGRRAFDESGRVAVEVIRGHAGPPDADPHRVDALSGATITSRGVGFLLQFWLGADGFGPYLDRLRKERGDGQGA